MTVFSDILSMTVFTEDRLLSMTVFSKDRHK